MLCSQFYPFAFICSNTVYSFSLKLCSFMSPCNLTVFLLFFCLVRHTFSCAHDTLFIYIIVTPPIFACICDAWLCPSLWHPSSWRPRDTRISFPSLILRLLTVCVKSDTRSYSFLCLLYTALSWLWSTSQLSSFLSMWHTILLFATVTPCPPSCHSDTLIS